MSYHIISIDEGECEITVSRGQLVVATEEKTRCVPMEDVAAIVITSFHCTLSSSFIVEASKKRVGIVVCDCYNPCALILPVNRITDTAIIRNLSKMTAQTKHRLWGKTLDAKCFNQYMLSREWNPSHPLLVPMLQLAKSNKETREAEVAKNYWRVFADTFCDGQFTRKRDVDGVNALLNYAYAILLSLVLRNLYALGIDPTFGIFHQSRAHAAPLAYDLVEPFRPIADAQVATWIQALPDVSQARVTKEFRAFIGKMLLREVPYSDNQISVKMLVEQVIRSFRKSVDAAYVSPYEPWKTSTTKWDG